MKRKSLLRRLLPWVILIAALAALVVFVFIPIYSQTEEVNEYEPVVYAYEGNGKPIAIENESLKLEMDTETTRFILTDKASGQVWYSNPVDADKDPIALSLNKDLLQATMTVIYTTNGGTVEMSNNQYSIDNKNFQISQPDENSIRVDYAMGKIERVYRIPQAITKERYTELTDKMSKSTKKKVQSNYSLVEPEKLDKKDNKEELIATYPSVVEQPLYILKAETSDTNKSKIQGYFEEAGYTDEDYAIDMALVAQTGTSTSGAVFNVSMILRLDGNDMVVEVPYDSIRYKADYPACQVKPLPMFGAAGTSDEGYIFVPEGGGSIIRYNNGKLSQNAYYANVYGWDYSEERKEVVSETENMFPVFGMTRPGASFIAISEGASSFCGISADISGRINSYNTVNAKYNVVHAAQYNVSAKTAQLVYVYEKAVPDTTMIQRYRFIADDSYVAMAAAYGDYLRERHPELVRAGASEEVPVSIELVGAINKIEVKAGLPLDSVAETTTFDQAGEIIGELDDAGIRNLNIRYSGWSNGGVKQKVLSSVRVLNELGGTQAMQKLIENAKGKNVNLFFDGISCFAYDSGIFDGFTPFSHAARFATKEQTILYPYSIIRYTQRDGNPKNAYYLVKPAIAKTYASNLISALKEKGAAGVAFRDIGNLLSGDLNPRDTVTREEVKAMNVETMKEARDNGQKIVIKKGNDYAVPYADLITDMELTGNAYALLDEDVPFYQIALHGMKDYTGSALNLSGDFSTSVLRCAEYGAGLNFTFMYRDTKVLQDTDYTGYYAGYYSVWKDDLLQTVLRYQNEMKGLNRQAIVGHELNSDQVSKTQYEDGTAVYVNYSEEGHTVDGIQVPARDYIVVKGGAKQ